jgi:hypothetical protein
MPGPGLFSGEDGGFVIYNESEEKNGQAEKSEPQNASDGKTP